MRGFSFVSYGFDTAAIRFSYGFHMAVIWISYGFDTYGIPEAYLKHAGGIPEVLLKHMDFILISYPFDTKIIHRSYINHTCGIHEPYMGHTQHRCEISLQARLLVWVNFHSRLPPWLLRWQHFVVAYWLYFIFSNLSSLIHPFNLCFF